MLLPLPTMPPRETHALWFPTTLYPDEPNPGSASTEQTDNTPSNPSLLSRWKRSDAFSRHTLQELIADEQRLELRKSNIRHFGASWIRPAGVPKTYQAMLDEAVERAEQESIARREAAMLEQTAAAEQDARGNLGATTLARNEGAADSDASINPEHDRDLDDDLPEGQDLLLDEDIIQADEEYRDLDDDIPEPGSYEHTETETEPETEDTSSDERDNGDDRDHSTINMLPNPIGP